MNTSKLKTPAGIESFEGAVLIPIEWVVPGQFQPRTTPITEESVSDLIDSIKENAHRGGLIEPIIVREIASRTDQSQYEIVAGERRWRAAQYAQLHKIPAIIRDYSDEEAAAVALMENIQRENLNPVEEAKGIQRLVEIFGWTAEQVGQRIGKKGSTVRHTLRLLTLDAPALELLQLGQITPGHARAILTLSDRNQRTKMARYAAKTKCSVRSLEKACNRLERERVPATPQRQSKDPNIQALERRLTEILGAEVSFIMEANGSGRTVIHWHSLDELEGQLEKIKGYNQGD